MIQLGEVNIPDSVNAGEEFKIIFKVIYFTFPFKYLFGKIHINGKSVMRKVKYIYWFWGTWEITHKCSINEDSNVIISTGYVK